VTTLVSCNRHKSVEGLWRLDRQRTTMHMGFNLKGQSMLRIEMKGDGVDLHDFVIQGDGSQFALMDRHYPLDGKEREESSYGERTLYISAHFEGAALYTAERIVNKDPAAASPETRTSVTYVLSSDGEQLIGTDEGGKIATYDRQ
jgi:hypothetical protein